MEVTQVQVGTDDVVEHVEVAVQRIIGVDRLYRINPSEAFLGIDSGIIIINQLLSSEDYQSVDSPDHELHDIVIQMESDKDVYLQGLEGEDYDRELARLDSCIWVVYTYTRGGGELENYVLPIHEFVAHTMQY